MFLIGIAGGSGSGKTTFAQKILKFAGSDQVTHLHQDSYYLPTPPKDLYVKDRPNFDHPDAFDWPLLRTQLRELKSGRAIAAPTYDFVTNSRRSDTLRIGPTRVCVFDGIYALWDEGIRRLLDLKIFLHVDADIRFIRRLHRDVKERGRSLDSIVAQYYDSVRPMHRQFLESTSQFADLVAGEETDIPAQVVASKIKTVLADSHNTDRA
ncbi:MAG: uridine kinase [Deltaproteobacteria bacterium]|nr:uridine kinase [Deltaproteobacteria bacterium]